MTSSPLISIVVPVYNVAPYLDECLQSIVGQTYSHLEIIVVDDGSTDCTPALCDRWAGQDERIRVIHQANGGQSVARNAALDIATGELLGFVDGDDWIEPDMYETLLSLLQTHDADIAVCSIYWEGKSRTPRNSGAVTDYRREEAIRALVDGKQLDNYLCDKLFKRALFEEIRLPEGRIFEDLAVLCKVCWRAGRVVMQEVPKYHYRINTNSSIYSKYTPLKDYQHFLSVYEQVQFVNRHRLYPQAARYVFKRGISCIEHTFTVASSAQTVRYTNDMLQKMHEFDRTPWRTVGFGLLVKRFLIYHLRPVYRPVYKLLRGEIKH
jgi:glycosyltransferase involved in cell wall biosynthesis